jgi:hypothetical protein
VQRLVRARIGGGDAGSRATQNRSAAAARDRAQRVQRSRACAGLASGGEHVEAQRAGTVHDELPRPKQSRDSTAERFHRPVGHGEKDQIRVCHARQLGVPPTLLGAIPRERNANAS